MKNTLILLIISIFVSITLQAQNVVVVIIDGARYSETFGDPDRTYVPKMAELTSMGTYCDNFYNEHQTWTSRAIPALMTGSWDGVTDTIYQGNSTQYTKSPSIFEYFRKQKNLADTESYYTIKYVSSLWLQSFHPEYGVDYWPKTISTGSTDNDVYQSSLSAMETDHPQFLWVYLADVDHEGHSGIWDNYTASIANADQIVYDLWQAIQADDFYRDNTTLLVTNDHGRHDDQHGGFSGHGCSCDGCQHIMMLAIGPNIKENYVSEQQYEIEDFAVTIAHILDVNPEYSTGEVMSDIFIDSNIENTNNNFNIEISDNNIRFYLEQKSEVLIELFDLKGVKVQTILNNSQPKGLNSCKYDNNIPAGVYFVKFKSNDKTQTIKILKN